MKVQQNNKEKSILWAHILFQHLYRLIFHEDKNNSKILCEFYIMPNDSDTFTIVFSRGPLISRPILSVSLCNRNIKSQPRNCLLNHFFSTTWRSLWPKGGPGSSASTTATRLKMTHHENRKQRAIITLTSSLLRRIRQPINRHLPLESVTWPCARIASSSGRVSGNKSGYLTCDYILESKSCQKHFQSHVSIWCVL